MTAFGGIQPELTEIESFAVRHSGCSVRTAGGGRTMTTSAVPEQTVTTKPSLSRLARVTLLGVLGFFALGASPAPVSFEPVGLVYRQMEGTYLKGPRGVFVDRARGDIYVADTQNDLVVVYDRNGVPRFAFGYNGEVKEPIKAVTDSVGRIYVLTGRTIKVFNYRGEYLRDFPFHGLDKPPVATAITADQNDLYVADATSGQVFVYDADHRLKRRFGEGGRIKSVAAMTVDTDGVVYLLDANAPMALQVYAPDGTFLRGWGAHESGPQNFSLPSGITVDGEGRVITVDMIRQQIAVFATDGTFQGRFGGLGSALGAVTYPSDVASDGHGRLYVVERQGNRLQIFEPRKTTSRSRSTRERVPDAVREQLRQAIGDAVKDVR
jgi:DNA-binding beta-propeller fold protein YncE